MVKGGDRACGFPCDPGGGLHRRGQACAIKSQQTHGSARKLNKSSAAEVQSSGTKLYRVEIRHSTQKFGPGMERNGGFWDFNFFSSGFAKISYCKNERGAADFKF